MAAAATMAYCQGSVVARVRMIAAPRSCRWLRRAGAVEKNTGLLVTAQAVEAVRAEQDEGEGGRERDRGGEQPAGYAGGGVADDGYGLDDGAWGDLAEGDGSGTVTTPCAVEAGPGSSLHAATASSNSAASSQPSQSTQRSRSILMWMGGPPNPVQPMRPHCRRTVTTDRRNGWPGPADMSP
jgi:hypothetical protein